MISEKIGNGLINDTYLIRNEDGSPAFVLQRINTEVFKDPFRLMDNALRVTAHIRSRGGITPEFIPFEDGAFLKTDERGVWRKMQYIDSFSSDSADSPLLTQGCGTAFGAFLRHACDFKDDLYETIPRFHDTEKRLSDCLEAADKDAFKRASNAARLLNEIEKRLNAAAGDYRTLSDCAPKRVTHNDTKISNVLFDKNTSKPICVIDLDTVMKGITLYDFGDAARSIALESHGSSLVFNHEKYGLFKDAYLKQTEDILTKDEKANLMLAVNTVSTELGVRFLEDYLRGDVYFKTNSPADNLIRAEKLLTYSFKLE